MAYGDLTKCVYHAWGWWRICLQFEWDVHGTATHPARIADLAGFRIRSDHWWGHEAPTILNSPACGAGPYLIDEDSIGSELGSQSIATATDGRSRWGLVQIANDPDHPWHLLGFDLRPVPIVLDYVTGESWPLGEDPYFYTRAMSRCIVSPSGPGGAVQYAYDRSQAVMALLGIGPCDANS